MLDINYIRANRKKVEDAIHNKGYEISLDQILSLDDERKNLSQRIDALRQERNQISAKMKDGKPDQSLIEKGKTIKKDLSELESKLSEVEKEYISQLKTVPNVPEDDVPVGLSEDENEVAEVVGKPRDFDFTPKNHFEIGQIRGWIDKERAAKVTGARFAYIKGDMVKLQMAIVNFVMDSLSDERVIKEIVEKSGLDGVSTKPLRSFCRHLCSARIYMMRWIVSSHKKIVTRLRAKIFGYRAAPSMYLAVCMLAKSSPKRKCRFAT